ncbi:matrix-binding protein [Actinoplanes sp. SE50]|uniref:polymorphic toxin-type HINT domain-containing protein n=1 Tax=unclassified Actinoplanes TaxID=2626549 RepID=UPI00023ED4D3|nr:MULTISPECIES: polymorphic toxin-type HINT domain-containing protein [unclassified Actinoplanes]AEV87312.1 Extracellular matrix-binding protein ebhB [Actinoplanes sp. SE50/110]ATO85712.1 matrix-binding protein [Actinoplanes sp. SE50]SLM03125.1 hypothetical protein ACSP50_6414 [Actinoplanes sp. SE50/110]
MGSTRRWRLLAGVAMGVATAVALPQTAVAAVPRVVAPAVAPAPPLTVQQALDRLLGGQTREALPTDNPIDDAALDRMLVQDLADYDADPEVRAAAAAVLATDDAAKIRDFLDNGLPVYRKAADQRKRDQAERDRAQVQEWAETGGPLVRKGAQAALDSGSDAKIAAFVATGQAAADLADKQDTLSAADKARTIQARVEQMVAQGGYEVQELGQAALDSEDPAVIEDFYLNGYQVASQQDADAQKQITDALAARSKAVADLLDLAQRAKQAADAQKKIIEASVAATKALTDAANAMALANKEAKQADAIYAADVPRRQASQPTHTADLSALRGQACQDASIAAHQSDLVTAQSGVAATAAQTLEKTGLSQGIAWTEVTQAQADAGTAARLAAETACYAVTATEAAGKTLDADHNATVDANNAVKYRQAAEREQAAAEKLADKAEKLAAAAQAAAADAKAQRLRAEKDAASAHEHADNAAAYYRDARRQRDIARAATAAAIQHSLNAYSAAKRAIDQQNIVVGKGAEAKQKQDEALAAAGRFKDKADRAQALIKKASADNENTKSKEFEAQAAEARKIAAETNCKYPDSPNGCPGTAEMQKIRDDATRMRTVADDAKKASDQSRAASDAAQAESDAAAADARRAAAAAAAAAADARAAANQARLARQDAADAKAAANRAIKDANKANADAQTAVQTARTAINKATAARADADLTARSAQDAVRQSAIAAFESRVSGRAALDARESADGIADPAETAIDVASAYATTDNDAAMAVDIAANAMLIGDAQATAAQKHADDAAAAAIHAQEMADKAVAQVKPAYLAAQKAAEAANRAVKASNAAIAAARDAAKEARGAITAANDAASAAEEAGSWAKGAADMAAQAGSDARSAQQAANNAAGFAKKADQAADNAEALSKKIKQVSDTITSISDGMWAVAQNMGRMAKTLQDIAWQAYNAEQAAAEKKLNDWIDDKAKWLNDHIGGSDVTKGFIDGAAGMVKGIIQTSNCVTGTFLGTDAATDEYTVPEVSYLPNSDKSCNMLVKGFKDLLSDPKQLLHWDDWKKNWKYALGETLFDGAFFLVTDGTGLITKIAESGVAQTAKQAIRDIAKLSAKDMAAGVVKFGTEKLVNAIKELGAVTTSRLIELAESLGGKLKITFNADELTAMSKAVGLKGIDAVENLLRNLKDTPLIKGIGDFIERCFKRNSFTPDTRVLLADGTSKAIADVRIGDQVLATDATTGYTSAEPVTNLITNTDTTFTDLTVQVADGQSAVLHTTTHHPFWGSDTKSWVDAGQLAPGSALATPYGGIAKVAAVRSFQGSQQMHNLTVAALHTYYVLAGDVPVLVHNCGVDEPIPTDFAPNTVYRAVRKDEDPAKGLFARGDGDVEPWQHVLSSPSDSPWISTTKDPAVAFGKYMKNGLGVVRIDLTKVPSEMVDAAGNLRVPPGYEWMEIGETALRDRELLIRGTIPADAITGYWPAG